MQNKMILTKYAAGQTNNRGIVVDALTINITIQNPTPALIVKLIELGYRKATNENGCTGDYEIDCKTPAELDVKRNPLRGLVNA